MNFLQLCQRFAREAGIPPISSVVNQTGESERAIGWVIDGYRYILNKNPNWKFLRTDVTVNVQAWNANYSATSISLAQFGEWKLDSFRAYDPAIGVADEQFVKAQYNYDAFRDKYGFGTLRTMEGRPQVITEKPDQSLLIWPLPDIDYTMVGEYYKSPADLAANADLPIFAAKFHMAIVWRALMFYGEYEGDGTVIATGQSEFLRVLAAMEQLYLPDMHSGGPMA